MKCNKRFLIIAAVLVGLACVSHAQNAINVTLSTSTSAGSTVTINPPSGSVTYDAANIYDSGTLWNRVRFPNTAEKISTGSLNGGTLGTFPLTYAQNLPLVNSAGSNTTARLSVAINIGSIESNSSRVEPSAVAGGLPDPLMKEVWRIYNGANGTMFTVTGLATNQEYDLYVYGSTTTDGQGCTFTLVPANVLGSNPGAATNSGGYSGNIFDAGFSPLASQGITWNVLHAVSDGVGKIIFSTTKNPSNGQYLSGFQLQPICEAPAINASPTNVTASVGNSVSFSIAATGTGLTYQWRKNGVPLASSGSVSGASSNTLTINPVAIADIALSPGYDCLVGNATGCSALSSAAKLYLYSTTLTATPLSPAINSAEVCRDTVLKLSFNQTPTLNNAGLIRIYDASNTTTPVDQIDLSQNVNGAQLRTIAGNPFATYPVIIAGNSATIFPNLGKLAASKTYFVTLDPGTFSDGSGALFGGLTNPAAWRFTTKSAGPANSTNIVVAADSSGDFCTVQGALDFLPSNNTQPILINIRKGQYQEIVNVNNKHQLTFRGEGREQTAVGYPNNNGLNPGAPWRAAFILNANDCTLENLTVTNRTPKGGGQAEAVDVEGTRNIFYNMNLASYQDTFLIHSSGKLVYFQDSLVQGDTDFIWGYGTVYFTNCEIRGMSSGTHVTQPRSPLGSNGFAFVNCRVTKGFSSGTFDLGRTIGTPTSPSQALFSKCLMDDAVTGYGTDAGANMGDYSCSNLTGTAAKTLAYSTHYTGSDSWVIAAQTASTWLYGWQPQVAPNILTNPVSQTVSNGQAVTFGVSVTGVPMPGFQWRKDGTNVVGQTGALFSIPNAQATDMGVYSVIVTNAAGSVISSNATLSVTSVVNSAPTNLVYSVSNGLLAFSWPDDHTGWRLEAQTNGLESGLGTNWSTVSGSADTNQISVPINTAEGSVFYRLAYP